MKNILVIYYTQTGQLKDVVRFVSEGIRQNVQLHVDELRIEPQKPFPFPWSAAQFFNAMPETVREEGIPILEPAVPIKKYDLIIFAFQPWFLSPSLPATSALDHPVIQQVLKDTPVITLIGSRNMWLNALEKVKCKLRKLDAPLVGNIALVDKSPNLVSTITILRWMLKGKQDPFMCFPKAGIQDSDLKRCLHFGEIIGSYLNNYKLQELHQKLLSEGAVSVKPNLVVLESRGVKAFRVWSGFIKMGGDPESFNRRLRVGIFSVALPTALFVLSPLTTILTWLILILKRRKLDEQVRYFLSTDYRENIFD